MEFREGQCSIHTGYATDCASRIATYVNTHVSQCVCVCAFCQLYVYVLFGVNATYAKLMSFVVSYFYLLKLVSYHTAKIPDFCQLTRNDSSILAYVMFDAAPAQVPELVQCSTCTPVEKKQSTVFCTLF